MPRPIVRKHLTAGQRQRVLDAYRRSRLSQRDFAAQAGIGLSTLQLWLRSAAAQPCPQTNAFVQVPNLLAQAPGPAVYRLHLPGGIDLEVGPGFRPAELASVLQLLRPL